MQLRFRTQLLTAIAATLLLVSCSKTNKQGKMIPKEAGFVIHWNSKSLAEKVSLAEIKETDWYKHMMEEVSADSTAPEFVKKLHDNIQHNGIDSLADLIFFGVNNLEEGMKLVVEGGLKDAKMFETFLKNVYPEGSIGKEGDISVMPVKDKAVVTWNNERFVVGIQAPSMGGGYSMGKDYGTDHAKDSSASSQLAAYCKKLYTLKDDENLTKDEKFTGLMNTEGDVHAWVNIEKLMGNSLPMEAMGAMSMMKLDVFTKGNISTYTASFDKGKISVRSKGYSGKELEEVLKKYSGGSINTDMLKNIPSQDIAGVFAFHFKPEGLKELVKLTGMDGLADLLLVRQGFTIDDFVKANKGDIMISVSDLTMKKDTFRFEGLGGKKETDIHDEPDAKIIFSASINDKDAFSKLIRAGKEQMGNEEKISYNSNANYFAIGNNADVISKYLAGGKNEPSFLSKLSGSAMGAYVDIQKILKAFESEAAKDSIGKKMWDESQKMWDNATLTGGDFSDGGYNMLYEVNLMDKDSNSLKQLVKYSMKMSALEREKMKQMEASFKLEDAKPTIDKTVPIHPSQPKKKKK